MLTVDAQRARRAIHEGVANMQQTHAERREGDRRSSDRRDGATESDEIDGLLYCLGRLNRVLVDVRTQVRDLRVQAADVRLDTAEEPNPLHADAMRRVARVEDALDTLRDDFDLARDAIETAFAGPNADGHPVSVSVTEAFV